MSIPNQGISVREHPILFSGEMVRRILAGEKTQTRRIMKPQPDVSVTDAVPRREYPHGPALREWYWRPMYGIYNKVPAGGWDFKCPYGAPGDRLWVRETWQAFIAGTDVPLTTVNRPDMCSLGFRASEEERVKEFGRPYDGPWRPSIFMPRWASRITLEITDVRVERLQEISDMDLLCEGIEYWLIGEGQKSVRRSAFRRLWDEINGKRASWESNPWVWAITFKRVEVPA